MLFIIALLLSNNLYAEKSNRELEREIKKLHKDLNKINKKLKKEIKTNKKSRSRLPKISGLFQQDINVYNGAYHSQLEGETASDIFTRRARLGVGDKHGAWKYFILLDFSKDEDFNSEIVMARLRYSGFKFGPVIDIGRIREDISLEALESSSHISTVSRSMLANTMSPYFSLGIAAHQFFQPTGLRYALGIYKGRGFGSSGVDEKDRVIPSVTARLSWAPFNATGRTLHFGIWGTRRKFGDGVELSLRDRAEVREADTRLVDYAAGGSKFAINTLKQAGLEFAASFDSFTLQSEFAEKEVEAVNANNDNSYEGKYVTLSYFLTGEKMIYKPKSATFRLPKPISKLGAWQVVVRNSEFDATSDSQGTLVTANTLGINYYYSKQLKFMLNYIDSKVEGPGTAALVGAEDQGKAYTFRIHYAF